MGEQFDADRRCPAHRLVHDAPPCAGQGGASCGGLSCRRRWRDSRQPVGPAAAISSDTRPENFSKFFRNMSASLWACAS